MSLQRSRYEGQQTVNSFNLFLDSEKASIVGDKQSEGDDVHIHFAGQTIEAGDGEFIRLSLLNFTMFNNTYMININNSRFNVRGVSSTHTFYNAVNIDRKNYGNLKDIASSFATNLGAYLASKSAAVSFTTSVKPDSTSMSQTDDRLLDITLTAKNGSTEIAHGITSLNIQCLESEGDSYTILGGLRLDDSSDTTFESLKISFPTTSTIKIQGYFPMQRLSDPYVYLRCNNAQNGLAMSVLNNDAGRYNADIVNSDIMAKLYKDVEYITYNSSTGDEFFLNLQQRKLANLRFTLTDSKGRKLGRTSLQKDLGTAAGLTKTGADAQGNPVLTFESNLQNTQGNLSFTAVLRVDIIRNRMPQKLESEGLPPALPARKAQAPLIWQDYGKPKH